jgi:hypothetical protein
LAILTAVSGDHCYGGFAIHVHAPQSGITVELRAYGVASFDADGQLQRVDTWNDEAPAQAHFAALRPPATK